MQILQLLNDLKIRYESVPTYDSEPDKNRFSKLRDPSRAAHPHHLHIHSDNDKPERQHGFFLSTCTFLCGEVQTSANNHSLPTGTSNSSLNQSQATDLLAEHCQSEALLLFLTS